MERVLSVSVMFGVAVMPGLPRPWGIGCAWIFSLVTATVTIMTPEVCWPLVLKKDTWPLVAVAVLAPTAAECTLQKSEGYSCLRSLAICQGLGGSEFFSEALCYAVLRGYTYRLGLCREFRSDFPLYRTYT